MSETLFEAHAEPLKIYPLNFRNLLLRFDLCTAGMRHIYRSRRVVTKGSALSGHLWSTEVLVLLSLGWKYFNICRAAFCHLKQVPTGHKLADEILRNYRCQCSLAMHQEALHFRQSPKQESSTISHIDNWNPLLWLKNDGLNHYSVVCTEGDRKF